MSSCYGGLCTCAVYGSLIPDSGAAVFGRQFNAETVCSSSRGGGLLLKLLVLVQMRRLPAVLGRARLIGSLKRIDVDVLGLSHLAVVGQVDDAVDLAQDLHEGERALEPREALSIPVAS